jgi:hypothetical protein
MVRQRVSHASRICSPEDAALALLAIGLVPAESRRSDATEAEIVDGIALLLAPEGTPVTWELNTAHGHAEGWETIAPVAQLAAVVRAALGRPRAVLIKCGDQLDPEDVLDFFEREGESAVLRTSGWTFANVCDVSATPE